MSAFGTKRTCRDEAPMSAFGGNAHNKEEGWPAASPTKNFNSFLTQPIGVPLALLSKINHKDSYLDVIGSVRLASPSLLSVASNAVVKLTISSGPKEWLFLSLN